MVGHQKYVYSVACLDKAPYTYPFLLFQGEGGANAVCRLLPIPASARAQEYDSFYIISMGRRCSYPDKCTHVGLCSALFTLITSRQLP